MTLKVYYFYDSINKRNILGVVGTTRQEEVVLLKTKKLLDYLKLDKKPILMSRMELDS